MNKHNDGGVLLTQTQISRYVAFAILGLLFVFIAGYYLGKKNQSEELAEHMKKEAFADQIYSSLCSMYTIDTEEIDSTHPAEGQHP